MNYDHAYHAGNFADVVKHVIFARLIAYMKRKPAPFRIVDTHAGAGRHELDSAASARNPEWREGIARLLAAHLDPAAAELIAPYLDVVRAGNPGGELVAYPGSPLIARTLMRPQDRLTAMELHPEAQARLKALFAGDHQVKTLPVDGYSALAAQMPPKERRALVLIDPPFEEANEFDRMLKALESAWRIFPQAVYVLWYPLKDDAGVHSFKACLGDSLIPDIVFSEFRLRAPSEPPRLYGSGMIVVNPPFVLKSELELVLAALLPVLASSPTASIGYGVIRPEASGVRS